MNPSRFLPLLSILLLSATLPLAAQNPAAGSVNLGETEVLKCEEKIASIRRDVLGKYEDMLGELQITLQKAADLEGALAVRTERQRVAQDHLLTERNFVAEPKALRALQAQQLAKMQELVAQIVSEAMPRLVELKKSMTVAGKLDDAVAVRTAIEKLQNSHVPVARADAGSVVPAETLLVTTKDSDNPLARIQKGQTLDIRGVCEGLDELVRLGRCEILR